MEKSLQPSREKSKGLSYRGCIGARPTALRKCLQACGDIRSLGRWWRGANQRAIEARPRRLACVAGVASARYDVMPCADERARKESGRHHLGQMHAGLSAGGLRRTAARSAGSLLVAGTVSTIDLSACCMSPSGSRPFTTHGRRRVLQCAYQDLPAVHCILRPPNCDQPPFFSLWRRVVTVPCLSLSSQLLGIQVVGKASTSWDHLPHAPARARVFGAL